MKDIFVYIIATIGNGKPSSPCKIGISSNPDSRAWALQTACPYELRLFKSYRFPNRDIALAIEDCFHSTQKTHRLRGEWFSMQPEMVDCILRLQIRWAIEMNTGFFGSDLHDACRLVGVA